MITPEQQAAFAQYKQSTGFKPATSATATTYDSIDSLVAKKREQPGIATPRTSQGPQLPLDDFSLNAIKAVTAPLVRTGGLVERGLDQTMGRVLNAASGNGFVPSNTGGKADDTAKSIEDSESQTLSGKAGALVGTIAPYFTGVGEEETAAQVASMLPKLAEHLGVDVASWIPKVTGFLAKSTPTVVRDAALGTAQTGDLKEGIIAGLGAPIAKGTLEAGGRFVNAIPKVVDNARLALSKGNIEPRVGVSAGRLQSSPYTPMGGAGAAVKPNTSELYDDFYKQEEKFKTDAKADTALGTVGGRIGDAYDQVVATRREVGKTMGEELKKVGGIKTDVGDTASNFESQLTENGVVGSEDGLAQTRTSKVSDSDLAILNDYKTRLDSLGPNPTVAELDAFLSRVPEEIKVYKAKNNITDVTNGERIIKNNLTQLRGQFDPTKTPALKEYAEARSAYSDLSDFLEEGQGFLGKKTQSGDYAKDASIAKSSVQSILNGGKKDWLMELENLTGYPAIDESVLALQAMKDAGNYRGLSLLETLANDSSLPTSKKDLIGKVIGGIYGASKKAFVGSPSTQTKRVLENL